MVFYFEATSFKDRCAIEPQMELESSMTDCSGRQASFRYDADTCDSYATFRSAVETAAKKAKVPVPPVICRMPNPGLGMMMDNEWVDQVKSEGLLEGDAPKILMPPKPPWYAEWDAKMSQIGASLSKEAKDKKNPVKKEECGS